MPLAAVPPPLAVSLIVELASHHQFVTITMGSWIRNSSPSRVDWPNSCPDARNVRKRNPTKAGECHEFKSLWSAVHRRTAMHSSGAFWRSMAQIPEAQDGKAER